MLRSLRRRSLARLRHEIEPVGADALGRFLVAWHGIGSGRRGLETLLDAIEQLQGAAMPASLLERQILPARVEDYQPAMLDTLMAAGEVVWTGVEPLGERDGRIALFLTDHAARLRAPSPALPPALKHGTRPDETAVEDPAAGRRRDPRVPGRARRVVLLGHPSGNRQRLSAGDRGCALDAGLERTGHQRHAASAAGLCAHRRTAPAQPQARRRRAHGAFRSRRLIPPAAEGRWALVAGAAAAPSPTDWAAAMASQLLTRHGIVTRETVAAEAVAGGFTAVYQVLRAMEEAGRIRRGYFVAGLGGAQFAMPAALDLLRAMREPPDEPNTVVLAATDPANPYGTVLKWPVADAAQAQSGRGPVRGVGAVTILVDGNAAAYLRRGERELLLFTPETEPDRSRVARQVAGMLLGLAASRDEARRGMLIVEINGEPAATVALAGAFLEEGFIATAMGLQAKPVRPRPGSTNHGDEEDAERP